MKYFILLVGCFMLAACTASQEPIVAPLPVQAGGLIIPDTIDFGMVTAGLSKDTLIWFRNTSSDTIRVTISSFRNTAFKLSDTAQHSVVIRPGMYVIQIVSFQFAPMEINDLAILDTVLWTNGTVDHQKVLLLRGTSMPFSNLFPVTPHSILISLKGLIGRDTFDNGNSMHSFDFYFSATSIPQQLGDTLVFSSGYDNHTPGDETNGDHGSNSQDHTSVILHIDAVLHEIDWLKATHNHIDASFYEKDGFIMNYGYREVGNSQELVLRGLPLSKNSTGWSGQSVGEIVKPVIESAQYQAYDFQTDGSGPEIKSHLTSITGYTDSASVSVSIH